LELKYLRKERRGGAGAAIDFALLLLLSMALFAVKVKDVDFVEGGGGGGGEEEGGAEEEEEEEERGLEIGDVTGVYFFK
jgi:hypothetical protein